MLSYIILAIAIGTTGFIGFILFKDGEKGNKNSNDNIEKGSNKNTTKSTIKLGYKKEPVKNFGTSQDLLDFERIEVWNEDLALIKRSENVYLGVFEVKGIPYNLLSFEERIHLEQNYAALLNAIDFPFQINIQSRTLELDHYVQIYEKRISEINKQLKNTNEKYELEDDEETKNSYVIQLEKLINQLRYGQQILQYFKDRNIQSNLLERKYYIICSYTHKPSQYENKLSNEEILEIAINNLYNKFNIFDNTLSRNGLKCTFLNGFELGEMLYVSFNKEDSTNLKFRSALESRFNHLCTTAKRTELKEIDLERQKVAEEREKLEKKLSNLLKK